VTAANGELHDLAGECPGDLVIGELDVLGVAESGTRNEYFDCGGCEWAGG
jgi:hypothetical protein